MSAASEKEPGDGQGAYQLVQLRNDTWTVRAMAEAETMHPSLGPMAEAETLHLSGHGLLERAAKARWPFVVWDVGLGAAANALAVLRALGDAPGVLRLVSFDLTTEPLNFALRHRDALAYFSPFEAQLAALLRDRCVRFSHKRIEVEWTLQLGDFPTLITSRSGPNPGTYSVGLLSPDVILFDPYSPAKNPAMWTQSLFSDLFGCLESGRPCSLTTYSRSTSVRVGLLLAGFYVGAGRKLEAKEETTVAANVQELIPTLLDRAWLQRVRRSHSAEPLTEAAYRQAPLSPETWEELQRHPQFN